MSQNSSVVNSPLPSGKTTEEGRPSSNKEETVESAERSGSESAAASKQNGDLTVETRPATDSTEDIPSTLGIGSDLGLSIEHGLETVYVEQRNGTFKATPTTDSMFCSSSEPHHHNQRYSRRHAPPSWRLRSALDVAVAVQKFWYCLSNFCFGLLAGVAALHLIIMFSTLPVSRRDPESNQRTVQIYSNTAFILPIVFYVCLTVCLVSLIDRFDTSQLENDELKETFSYKFTWLVIVLYLLIFLLHALSAKYDDLFVLSQHDDSLTYPPHRLVGQLEVWRWLDGSKCVLCLLGWSLVSLVPSKDFLLHHLQYLKTYDLDAASPPA